MKIVDDLKVIVSSKKLSDDAFKAIVAGLGRRRRFGVYSLLNWFFLWLCTLLIILLILSPVLVYSNYIYEAKITTTSGMIYIIFCVMYGKIVVSRLLKGGLFCMLIVSRKLMLQRFQSIYKPEGEIRQMGYPGLAHLAEVVSQKKSIRLYLRNFGLTPKVDILELEANGFTLGSGMNNVEVTGREIEKTVLFDTQDTQYSTFLISDINDPTPPTGVSVLYADDQNWKFLIKDLIQISDQIVILILSPGDGLDEEINMVCQFNKQAITKVYATENSISQIEHLDNNKAFDITIIEHPHDTAKRELNEHQDYINEDSIPLMEKVVLEMEREHAKQQKLGSHIELDFYDKLILPIIIATIAAKYW